MATVHVYSQQNLQIRITIQTHPRMRKLAKNQKKQQTSKHVKANKKRMNPRIADRLSHAMMLALIMVSIEGMQSSNVNETMTLQQAQMPIFVVHQGVTHCVEVTAQETVGNVRIAAGLLESEYLSFGGKALSDEGEALSDAGIGQEAMLHVHKRPDVEVLFKMFGAENNENIFGYDWQQKLQEWQASVPTHHQDLKEHCEKINKWVEEGNHICPQLRTDDECEEQPLKFECDEQGMVIKLWVVTDVEGIEYEGGFIMNGEHLREMMELKELYLQGDQIDDNAIQALRILPEMPKMIKLTFFNTAITNIDFVKYLHNIQNLTMQNNYSSDISRNGIIDPLFDLLESSANLKQLNFDLVAMTPPYLIKFCDSDHLERQRKLEELCTKKGVEHRFNG